MSSKRHSLSTHTKQPFKKQKLQNGAAVALPPPSSLIAHGSTNDSVLFTGGSSQTLANSYVVVNRSHLSIVNGAEQSRVRMIAYDFARLVASRMALGIDSSQSNYSAMGQIKFGHAETLTRIVNSPSSMALPQTMTEKLASKLTEIRQSVRPLKEYTIRMQVSILTHSHTHHLICDLSATTLPLDRQRSLTDSSFSNSNTFADLVKREIDKKVKNLITACGYTRHTPEHTNRAGVSTLPSDDGFIEDVRWIPPSADASSLLEVARVQIFLCAASERIEPGTNQADASISIGHLHLTISYQRSSIPHLHPSKSQFVNAQILNSVSQAPPNLNEPVARGLEQMRTSKTLRHPLSDDAIMRQTKPPSESPLSLSIRSNQLERSSYLLNVRNNVMKCLLRNQQSFYPEKMYKDLALMPDVFSQFEKLVEEGILRKVKKGHYVCSYQ